MKSLPRSAHHSQLALKSQDSLKRAELQELLDTLRPFLDADTVYAEIGAGDCALTMMVAPFVRKAYAIDVSETVTRGASAPNLEVVLSDGVSTLVKATLIFSNQLMEHLHPDDAVDQLANVFAALGVRRALFLHHPQPSRRPARRLARHRSGRPRIPPARIHEPELAGLFRSVGFGRVQAFVRIRNFQTTLPLFFVTALEAIIGALPRGLGYRAANLPVLRRVLEVQLIATRR